MPDMKLVGSLLDGLRQSIKKSQNLEAEIRAALTGKPWDSKWNKSRKKDSENSETRLEKQSSNISVRNKRCCNGIATRQGGNTHAMVRL